MTNATVIGNDIRELTETEIETTAGAATAVVHFGPLSIWASPGHGFGINLGGVGGFDIGPHGMDASLKGVGTVVIHT